MQEHLKRRDVIKTLMVTSITSLVGNKVWAGKLVSEISAAAPNSHVGTARIRLADFPALNSDGGSVRLGSSSISTGGGAISIGYPNGLYYPILINRISSTEYVALDAACAHEQCTVPVANSSGEILCAKSTNNCGHGTRYNIRGKVISSEPGISTPLRNFPVQLKDGFLIIKVGDQDFNMAQKVVLTQGERWLQITWDSFIAVEYELRYTPNFATEPVKINFATTLGGAQTTAFVTGNDELAVDPRTKIQNENARKMFIQPMNGFYQVATVLRPI